MEPVAGGSKRARSHETEEVFTLSLSNPFLSLKTKEGIEVGEILRLATSEAGAVIKVSGLHVVPGGDAIALQKEKDKGKEAEAFPIRIDFCALDDSVQWQPLEPIVKVPDAPADSLNHSVKSLLLPIVLRVNGIAPAGEFNVLIPRLAKTGKQGSVPSATLTVKLCVGERFVEVTLSRLRPVTRKGKLTVDHVITGNAAPAPIGSPMLSPFNEIPPPPLIEASDRLRDLIHDLGSDLLATRKKTHRDRVARSVASKRLQ